MSRLPLPAALQLCADLHAQGLLNHDLSAHLGISVATVKRWKRRLGLDVTHAGSLDAPFDLYISGRRVDVKAATYSPAYRGWGFRLPRERSSFNNTARRTAKEYERDCD